MEDCRSEWCLVGQDVIKQTFIWIFGKVYLSRVTAKPTQFYEREAKTHICLYRHCMDCANVPHYTKMHFCWFCCGPAFTVLLSLYSPFWYIVICVALFVTAIMYHWPIEISGFPASRSRVHSLESLRNPLKVPEFRLKPKSLQSCTPPTTVWFKGKRNNERIKQYFPWVYNNADITFFSCVLTFAKPECDNMLQLEPRSGKGCNTLLHEGLAKR